MVCLEYRKEKYKQFCGVMAKKGIKAKQLLKSTKYYKVLSNSLSLENLHATATVPFRRHNNDTKYRLANKTFSNTRCYWMK